VSLEKVVRISEVDFVLERSLSLVTIPAYLEACKDPEFVKVSACLESPVKVDNLLEHVLPGHSQVAGLL